MDLSVLDPVKILIALILATTPLILAAIGELVVEKSGVLNLGVEGIMIIGAIGGFASSVLTGNPYLGLVMGGLSGVLLSLLFGVLTQIFLTNQVATGLALTLFGLGLSAVIGENFTGLQPPSSVKFTAVPILKDVSLLGALFVLLAWSSVMGVHWFLNKSRGGLVLRSVGENHNAAHAIGFNVIGVRFMAIAFGGLLAGLGGACISLVRVPQWNEDMTAGIGWIALALVVFGAWKPWRVLFGAFLFGGFISLELNLQGLDVPIEPQYLKMLPFLMTILVLVLMSRRASNLNAPQDLGRTFVPNS